MGIKDSFHRQLPKGAKVEYKTNADGDKVPKKVTYDTERGGKKTVDVKLTADGDYAPTTGRTIDGDHNYPDKKWDIW